MPYINRHNRPRIDSGELEPGTAGELNYAMTMIAVAYINRNGTNYTQLNDVLGAFEGAKLEFYRRVVAPMEDEAIAKNGDLY